MVAEANVKAVSKSSRRNASSCCRTMRPAASTSASGWAPATARSRDVSTAASRSPEPARAMALLYRHPRSRRHPAGREPHAIPWPRHGRGGPDQFLAAGLLPRLEGNHPARVSLQSLLRETVTKTLLFREVSGRPARLVES